MYIFVPIVEALEKAQANLLAYNSWKRDMLYIDLLAKSSPPSTEIQAVRDLYQKFSELFKTENEFFEGKKQRLIAEHKAANPTIDGHEISQFINSESTVNLIDAAAARDPVLVKLRIDFKIQLAVVLELCKPLASYSQKLCMR